MEANYRILSLITSPSFAMAFQLIRDNQQLLALYTALKNKTKNLVQFVYS